MPDDPQEASFAGLLINPIILIGGAVAVYIWGNQKAQTVTLSPHVHGVILEVGSGLPAFINPGVNGLPIGLESLVSVNITGSNWRDATDVYHIISDLNSLPYLAGLTHDYIVLIRTEFNEYAQIVSTS